MSLDNLAQLATLLFRPTLLFSTLVELELNNVFLSVCSKNCGAAGRSDLAGILHSCSLGEYMGCFFIFQKTLIFGVWDEFSTIATIGPLSSWENTDS